MFRSEMVADILDKRLKIEVLDGDETTQDVLIRGLAER